MHCSLIMNAKRNRLLCADSVRKFIGQFPDLKYDGSKVICLVCHTSILCRNQRDCFRHVNTKKHKHTKSHPISQKKFVLETIYMLTACNLPFRLVEKEPFREFWSTYNTDYELPSARTLRNYLPTAREKMELNIKSALKNKKLWLCVDEITDCKKNSVVNIMARTMEPLKSSSSILLASRRVQKCTPKIISKLALNTLEKFELSPNQLIMIVTDGAGTMDSVGHCLKKEYGSLLHVTCKIHALHLVAETIRDCYPDVDTLIASTKSMFRQSPKHIREFHRLCPHIPEPPQAILTRWGTWLKAAFYYHKYFQDIKMVVLTFDPKEAALIENTQIKFDDSQIEIDLQSIRNNYFGLLEAIEELQNPSVSLADSLQIMNDVHAQLCVIGDTKNYRVIQMFESVLDNDRDFAILRQICEGASTDPLNCFKDSFNYANITSIDAERSFCAYKHIFSPQRSGFSETALETHLMLHIFNQSYPVCDFTEAS